MVKIVDEEGEHEGLKWSKVERNKRTDHLV